VVREAAEATVLLLAPVVPHITEEMWQMLGYDYSLLTVSWPAHKEDALKKEQRLIVIQVNGKVRSKIQVPASFSKDEIEAAALNDSKLKSFVGDKQIRKVIVVQQKLVNVVI